MCVCVREDWLVTHWLVGECVCAGGLVSYTLAGGRVCVCAGGLVSYTLAGGRLGGLVSYTLAGGRLGGWRIG